jgi:hypothetical protein
VPVPSETAPTAILDDEEPDDEIDSIDEDNPETHQDPMMEEDGASENEEPVVVPVTSEYHDSKWSVYIPEEHKSKELRSSTASDPSLPSGPSQTSAALNIPKSCISAGSFLDLLFDQNILETFVRETNQYAIGTNCRNWTALTVAELKVYFALTLYMGIVRRPSRRMYWIGGIYGDPFVTKTMKRVRFFQISSNLHWIDTSNITPETRKNRNKADGYWTVDEFLNSLCYNFKYYYKCGQCINIDEMCIFFKGRHRCRCYNPKKPNKWHLKAYCLNDSKSGYLWDFFMYRGKDENRPANVSATHWPVKKLTEDSRLHKKNHVLATDNWYTSIPVLREVCNATKDMHLVGTVKIKSRGLPPSAVMKKKDANDIPRGVMKCRKHNSHKIYFTAWKDNKPVHFLSTWKTKFTFVDRNSKDANGMFRIAKVKIPTIVKVYNDSMGGTDLCDQLGSYYDDRKRTITWQHRIILHFLRVSCINAMVLRNHTRNIKKSDLLQFLMDVIEDWSGINKTEPVMHVDASDDDLDVDLEPEPDLLNQEIHPTTWARTLKKAGFSDHKYDVAPCTCPKRPQLCQKRHRKRCKICHVHTQFICKDCGIFLCPPHSKNKDCWVAAHPPI